MKPGKTLSERMIYIAFYAEITLLELWLAFVNFMDGATLLGGSGNLSVLLAHHLGPYQYVLPTLQLATGLLLGWSCFMNRGRRTHWFILLSLLASCTWLLELVVIETIPNISYPTTTILVNFLLSFIVFLRASFRVGHEHWTKKEASFSLVA